MVKENTVAQLLEAAGEVFAEKGLKDATVREICSRANVNLAAVNYHFGDKERLYIEAVKNARALIEEDVPLPPITIDLTPEQRLGMFVKTMVGRLLNPKAAAWQHQLLVREIMEPTKACEEMVHESFQPFVDSLLETIREMVPNDLPEHLIQMLGFSIISQCVYYRAHDRLVSMLVPASELKNFDPDTIAKHIVRFSLAAISSYNNDTILTHE